MSHFPAALRYLDELPNQVQTGVWAPLLHNSDRKNVENLSLPKVKNDAHSYDHTDSSACKPAGVVGL
jgi:hypothetical protein